LDEKAKIGIGITKVGNKMAATSAEKGFCRGWGDL